MVRPEGENSFHLVTFATHLGDGSGANRPWLQETPDPMTTITWNSWVEINPQVAEELDIHHDDVVLVKSAAGEIEATAYLYPAIRPDTIAIPFGQGHTALGRYAEGRGVNPMDLIEVKVNEAGELAVGDTLVTIEKTGRRRPLAHLESIKGVYGEH
jgi:anaerobic selenocysteine-containing dehydrogenase